MFLRTQKSEKKLRDIQFDRNLTDLMKFVACLMVAMSRYSGYVLANGISSNIVYKVIAANGGYLGVAVFFFLSGYGLMKSNQKRHLGVADFFKRRLLKTYLPAVLVSALWLGFASLTSMGLLCNKQYFLGVVWLFNDEVMWFVNSILMMYVAFRLYLVASSRMQNHQWIALGIICLITYWLLRFFNIGSTLSVPLFFVGIAVAQYGKAIRQFIQNVWVDVALIFCAMVLLWLFRHDNYLLHGWINYVTMGLILWTMSRWNISLCTIPKWVGACSYDIYLVHYKVHLALLFFFGLDKLWMFALGTTIVTILFYNMRRLLI